MELIKSSPFEYINRTFDSISNFVIYKQYSFSAHARKLHVFINNCLFHTARMKKLKNYCVGHWSFIIHVYIYLRKGNDMLLVLFCLNNTQLLLRSKMLQTF